MTYHTRMAEDGRLALPAEVAQAFGVLAGEMLSIELDNGALIVSRAVTNDTPLGRLRAAMRGYSVDRFLRERRADWSE